MYEKIDTPVEADQLDGGNGKDAGISNPAPSGEGWWDTLLSSKPIYSPNTSAGNDALPTGSDVTLKRAAPYELTPAGKATSALSAPQPAGTPTGADSSATYDPYLPEKEQLVIADKVARQRSGEKLSLTDKPTQEQYNDVHSTDPTGEADPKRKAIKLEIQRRLHGVADEDVPKFVKGFSLAEKYGIDQAEIERVAKAMQDDDGKDKPLSELKKQLAKDIKSDYEAEHADKIAALRKQKAIADGAPDPQWSSVIDQLAAQNAATARNNYQRQVASLYVNKKGETVSADGYTTNELMAMRDNIGAKARADAEKAIYGSQEYKKAIKAKKEVGDLEIDNIEKQGKLAISKLANADIATLNAHLDLRVDTATDDPNDVNHYSTQTARDIAQKDTKSVSNIAGRFLTAAGAGLANTVSNSLHGLLNLAPNGLNAAVTASPRVAEAVMNPKVIVRPGATPIGYEDAGPDPLGLSPTNGMPIYAPTDYVANPNYNHNTPTAQMIRFADSITDPASKMIDASSASTAQYIADKKYAVAPGLKPIDEANAKRMAEAVGPLATIGAALTNTLTNEAGLGDLAGSLLGTVGTFGAARTVSVLGSRTAAGAAKNTRVLGLTSSGVGEGQNARMETTKQFSDFYTKPENQGGKAWEEAQIALPNASKAQIIEYLSRSAGNGAYAGGSAAAIVTMLAFGGHSFEGAVLKKMTGEKLANAEGKIGATLLKSTAGEAAQEGLTQVGGNLGAAATDTQGKDAATAVIDAFTEKQVIANATVGGLVGFAGGARQTTKPAYVALKEGLATARDTAKSRFDAARSYEAPNQNTNQDTTVAPDIEITAEMLDTARATKPAASEAAIAEQLRNEQDAKDRVEREAYMTRKNAEYRDRQAQQAADFKSFSQAFSDTKARNTELLTAEEAAQQSTQLVEISAQARAYIDLLNKTDPSAARDVSIKQLDTAYDSKLIAEPEYVAGLIRIAEVTTPNLTPEQITAKLEAEAAKADLDKTARSKTVTEQNVGIVNVARATADHIAQAEKLLGASEGARTGTLINDFMGRPKDEVAVVRFGDDAAHYEWAQNKLGESDHLIYSNDEYAIGITRTKTGVDKLTYVENTKKSTVEQYTPAWAEANRTQAERVSSLYDALKPFRYKLTNLDSDSYASLQRDIANTIADPLSEARLAEDMTKANEAFYEGYMTKAKQSMEAAATSFAEHQKAPYSNVFNAAIARAIGIDKADVSALNINEIPHDKISAIRTSSTDAKTIEAVNDFKSMMQERRAALRSAELISPAGAKIGDRPFRSVKPAELAQLADIISVEKGAKASSAEPVNKADAAKAGELRVELAAHYAYGKLLDNPEVTLTDVIRVARGVAQNDNALPSILNSVNNLARAKETKARNDEAIQLIYKDVNELATRVEANPIKANNTSLGPVLSSHMAVADLTQFVEKAREGIPREARIKVYANIADAQADPSSGVGGSIGFRGLTVHLGDQTYNIILIADRIANSSDAGKVLMHELAGHFAPSKLLGPSNLMKLRTAAYKVATSKSAPAGLRNAINDFVEGYRETTKSEDYPNGKDPGNVRIAEEALGWFAEQGDLHVPDEIRGVLATLLKGAPGELAGSTFGNIINMFKGYATGKMSLAQANTEVSIAFGDSARQGIQREYTQLFGTNFMDQVSGRLDDLAPFQKGLGILSAILGNTEPALAKAREIMVSMRNLRHSISNINHLFVDPAIDSVQRNLKQLKKENTDIDVYTAADTILKAKYADELNNSWAFRNLDFDKMSDKYDVEKGYRNADRAAIIAELAALDPKSDTFEVSKRDINRRVVAFLDKHPIDWSTVYAAGNDMTKPLAAIKLTEMKANYKSVYDAVNSEGFQRDLNSIRRYTLRAFQESGSDAGNISHLQNDNYVPMSPKEAGKALAGSNIKDFATVSGRDLFVREGLGRERQSPTGQLQTMMTNARMAGGEPLRNAFLNNFADFINDAGRADPSIVSALPQGSIETGPDLGTFANIVKLGELGVSNIDTQGRADAMIFRRGNEFFEMVITEPKLREAMMTSLDRNEESAARVWGRYFTRSTSLTLVKGKPLTVANAVTRDVFGAFTAAAASFGGTNVLTRFSKELVSISRDGSLAKFIFSDADARAAMMEKDYAPGTLMHDLKLFILHGGYVAPHATQGFDNIVRHTDETGLRALLSTGPKESTIGGSIKAVLEKGAEGNAALTGFNTAIDKYVHAVDLTENTPRFALFRAVLNEGSMGTDSSFTRLGGRADVAPRKFTAADAGEVAYLTKSYILDTGHTGPISRMFGAWIPFFGARVSDVNTLFKRKIWAGNEAPVIQVQGADGRYYSQLKPGFIKELNPGQHVFHAGVTLMTAAILGMALSDDEWRNIDPKDMMENILIPGPMDADGNRSIYKIPKAYGIDVMASIGPVLALVGAMKSTGSTAFDTRTLGRDVFNLFSKHASPLPEFALREGSTTTKDYVQDFARAFAGIASPLYDIATNRTYTGASITPGLSNKQGQNTANYPLTRMTTPDAYYNLAKSVPGNMSGDEVRFIVQSFSNYLPGLPYAMSIMDEAMSFDKRAVLEGASDSEVQASAKSGSRFSGPGFKIENTRKTPEGSMYSMYKEHIFGHELDLSYAQQRDIESGKVLKSNGRISDSLDLNKMGPEQRAYYQSNPGLLEAKKVWRDYQRDSRESVALAKEGRATDNIDKRIAGVTDTRKVALRYEQRMKQALRLNQ